MLVRVDSIKVPKNRIRKVDKQEVERMAESISRTRMLNPIVVSGDKGSPVLVAGAHRLAAYKLLGRDEIPCTAFMSVDDHDQLKLAEIDENLVRNELSAAEKAKHIQLKVELLAKGKFDTKKDEKVEAYRKRNHITKAQETDKACPKVALKAAKSAAKAEAIQEAAEAMGTDPTHVRAEIRKAEALDKMDIDIEDTSKLTGNQLGHLAKVANSGQVEAARNVVEKVAKAERPEKIKVNVEIGTEQLEITKRYQSRLQAIINHINEYAEKGLCDSADVNDSANHLKRNLKRIEQQLQLKLTGGKITGTCTNRSCSTVALNHARHKRLKYGRLKPQTRHIPTKGKKNEN